MTASAWWYPILVILTPMLVLIYAGCSPADSTGSGPPGLGPASPPSALPGLPPQAQPGMTAFNANCAVCHGANAAGTNQGPPLVHRVYEPNHHQDFAFRNAVRNGVPSHHWQFGDMLPVPGLSDEEVDSIICYVRELQRDEGIISPDAPATWC